MRERLLIWLVPRLIRLIIAFLSLTIRWQRLGGCYDPAAPERHIFAFWHARILMMGVALRGCRGYTLISEHRDGGYIADTLQLQCISNITAITMFGDQRITTTPSQGHPHHQDACMPECEDMALRGRRIVTTSQTLPANRKRQKGDDQPDQARHQPNQQSLSHPFYYPLPKKTFFCSTLNLSPNPERR